MIPPYASEEEQGVGASSGKYSEADLRAAFRAGWNERNSQPGLKRQTRKSLDNALLGAMGGGRFAEVEYVPDKRSYHSAIWVHSAFRKSLRDSAAPSGERP